MGAWVTKKSFIIVYRIVSGGSGCRRQCRPVVNTAAYAAPVVIAWVTNKLSIIVRTSRIARWGKKESALEPAGRVGGGGYHRQ